MIKIVFLDMDGVLSNFHKGVHKVFGKPYIYNSLALRRYDFWENWNPPITRDMVDSICTTSFWRNLEWMHDGFDILQIIRSKFIAEQVYLLTVPMPNVESPTGKWLWVRDKMPAIYLKQTIITQAPKHLLARPDTLLIDDKDQNIDEFIKAGGQGCLVPRPWNRAHLHADRTVEVVKNFLEDLE